MPPDRNPARTIAAESARSAVLRGLCTAIGLPMRWRSRGVCRVPASRGEPLQLQPEFGELRGIARALGRCSGTRLAPLLTFSRFDLLFDIRKAFAVHIETALFKLNECSSPELRPSLQPLKD